MTAPAAVHSDDFYERLNVSHTATADDVKRAYRELVRRYPPERAPEEFKRIREAYETLSNPQSRHEYDHQPDPAIERWLTTALHAMKAEDYPVAERYFKQVLLQAPDLGFVRNMLGLCFLYQAEPTKAATQFERLLTQPDAPAAWFANAGHAYQALERYRDAEHAFEEAIRRATDNPVEYFVGLADVLLDQDAFPRAVAVLERGIHADGTVDFQDLRYFTKLLEVRIRERSEQGVAAVLSRIREIATGEEERRFAAFKLGLFAQQLIAVGGFSFAATIASAARILQPQDADYVALLEAARLMARNDYAGVEQLISTHPSFATGGWLNQLGGTIRRYCGDHRALAQMRPITAAPSLQTINGIGTRLYGRRDEDARTGSYVSTLYFVVFMIPLFPITCYRVISRGHNSWSFLGKVPYSNREKRHWMGFAIAALFLFLWGNSSDSARPTRATSAPTASVSSGTDGSSDPVAAVLSSGSPAAEQAVQRSRPVYSSRRSSASDWYDAEKGNVQHLEARVKRLNRELESSEGEIESLRRQIQAIEGGYGVYSTGDLQYQLLIDRHNAQARDYNATLLQQRAAYREYKNALDAFNEHVESYNSGRRQ